MSIFENVVYPLRIDGEKNHSVLEEVCEISLRGAALWDEVKDCLNESCPKTFWRPTTTPLHRSSSSR